MDLYIVKVSSKYFNRLIHYSISILNIKRKGDFYYLSLDKENYDKIMKFQKIYEIELVDFKGLIKYKHIFKNNLLFFIFFFLSLGYLFFLSNIIFSIEIKTNNKEIEELVKKELSKNGISLYKFVKSFNQKEEVKKKIIKDNKDQIDWIEITRSGTRYIVNVEQRVIKELEEDKTPVDIVALKNAIILSIDARSGSIVKKLNDYVKKGDIIVTGSITHKDSVVDLVHASATIYGETWYNVHVSYPFAYYEKSYTGNSLKRLNINFFNKSIKIGKKFQNEEIEEINIFSHKYIPVKFSLEEVKEIVIIDDLYTIDDAYIEGVKIAREKLLNELPKDSRILEQKKLKIVVNNSTIDVDIFFKVYENITDVRKIEEKSK